MEVKSSSFIALADIALHKPDQRRAVALGTRNGYNARLAAMSAHGHEHGEALRRQAAAAKRRALAQLPELLEEAERKLTENGFRVLWAADAAEAGRHALQIAQAHGVGLVTKSKSMLTEEIALNHVLEAAGIRVVETDLGEYIIQLVNEPPSHIIAPVIHKTREQIRDIFVEKLGMEPTDDAGQMVAFARQVLRRDFLAADMGVSGGNFIIAESGSLALVTNEGNGRMCTSMPSLHVALVGIEKIVATLQDYATLTQVLPRSGTGQDMAIYTTIINGPRRPDEADGPQEVYIILVDNGRSDIYATDYAEALTCIRCGACQNACPVYRSTGGHAYGWVYGGPIGAVLTPLYVGLENAAPLPQASSLCGACKQVCPVDIDLPRMLLDLRAEGVRRGQAERSIRVGMKAWALAAASPARFELAGRLARLGQRVGPKHLPGPLGGWTQYRDFPGLAPKSFRELWRERQKGRGT